MCPSGQYHTKQSCDSISYSRWLVKQPNIEVIMTLHEIYVYSRPMHISIFYRWYTRQSFPVSPVRKSNLLIGEIGMFSFLAIKDRYSGKATLRQEWAGFDRNDTMASQKTDVNLCFTEWEPQPLHHFPPHQTSHPPAHPYPASKAGNALKMHLVLQVTAYH